MTYLAELAEVDCATDWVEVFMGTSTAAYVKIFHELQDHFPTRSSYHSSMDTLTAVLDGHRARGAHVLRVEMQAPWSIAVAILVSATVGAVFGLMPAARAAQLDPVEALRHE